MRYAPERTPLDTPCGVVHHCAQKCAASFRLAWRAQRARQGRIQPPFVGSVAPNGDRIGPSAVAIGIAITITIAIAIAIAIAITIAIAIAIAIGFG